MNANNLHPDMSQQEASMFNVGDRVRVDSPSSSFHGMTGSIVDRHDSCATMHIVCLGDEGEYEALFATHELAPHNSMADDMPSKMHKAFAALEAYGCNNLAELLSLIDSALVDDAYGIQFSDLADCILHVLRGQVLHLREEADRVAQQYRSKAAQVAFFLDNGPL